MHPAEFRVDKIRVKGDIVYIAPILWINAEVAGDNIVPLFCAFIYLALVCGDGEKILIIKIAVVKKRLVVGNSEHRITVCLINLL